MKGKRLWQTLHIYLTLNVHKRTKYLRDNHVFAAMGENCSIMDRKFPLYANLIKLGNNVHIASKVDFIDHDITHVMLNGMLRNSLENDITEPTKRGECIGNHIIREKIGCIEVGDNVFIGSNTTILQNVRIGSNVIIGACTLVNRDIPDNSVVGGVPAKVIGSFDEFMHKRLSENLYPDEFKVSGEAVNEEFAKFLWNRFYEERRN